MAWLLGCRGPEFKPFYLGTDELVFDGLSYLQIIANWSDFHHSGLVTVFVQFKIGYLISNPSLRGRRPKGRERGKTRAQSAGGSR